MKTSKILILAVVFVLIATSLVGCFGPSEKVFSKAGMSITLDSGFNEKENLNRVELINSFFSPETDEIRGSDGEYLLDVLDFYFKGLDLTEGELDRIFCTNFQNFVGEVPAKVVPRLAVKECRRIRLMLKIMSLIDRNLTPDYSVVNNAEAFFKKQK